MHVSMLLHGIDVVVKIFGRIKWHQEPRSTYMVQINSGYKESGELVTVLQQHRRSPQAKETTSTMTSDQLFGQDDLETKDTPLKGTYMVSGYDDDDDNELENINKTMKHGSHHPFKVKAKIDILTYDDTIDAEKLDSWLDQIETYFTLYGQTAQEYTTKFHRLRETLGILTDNVDVFTKYVAGLPFQTQTEMRLHVTTNISNASSIAMAIEQKNKIGGRKFEERINGEGFNGSHQKKDSKKKGVAHSSDATKYCDTCRITEHNEENCWKVHLELFPKKWIKDDRGRRTIATTFVDDVIELESVNEADNVRQCKPRWKSLDTHVECDEKELFTMKIQVKHEVIEAIVDTGSQKNLISPSLVRNLGLKTTPHLLRTLWVGSKTIWIHKSVSNGTVIMSFTYGSQHLTQHGKSIINHLSDTPRVLKICSWSPTEQFVFASSCMDKTIAIWDTRLGKSPAASIKANDADVNVISWNMLASCMLASGSDAGAFSIRDLRMLEEGDAVVAHFMYHKCAITSIEWSPHKASTLAVSSDDNQLITRRGRGSRVQSQNTRGSTRTH
uniref:Glutamate-rich WD repeat-containing protein 1 n=1 Tax=Tanacetum cinerariifolium TaxID=118510 RepID=A0A699H9X3_TANCI|nr:glutamate-rich WD repeat-containing protein 1 [Tanacetum cinerariifolium]